MPQKYEKSSNSPTFYKKKHISIKILCEFYVLLLSLSRKLE